jgi:NADH:ubiquinone oxidoreductase subunit 2 (subunit N)
MYSIVLIEIISFIFIGVATKERGEKSIKSIMTKESVVAYLIPSLFSYILGLISLALSGGLSGTLSTPISALTHGYPIFGLYAPTIFMSVSLIIKMGIFPFFVYALNVNKGISWGGIIFIGVIAKIPIVILMLYYGNTIGPNIITFCGVLSLVIASMAAFTTPHAKKFMACSSLAAMG